MGKINIFGIWFDDLSIEEAVRKVFSEQEPQLIVTPNALMLEACFRNPDYRRLLNQATMVLPDGAGVVMAAKRQGTPLRGRVAGIDFGEALLERASHLEKRVFFLGGKDGIAPAAAEKMKRRYPGLCVCGCYWGYFDRYGEENFRLREWICSANTEILLVCLGFPIQEEWIAENLAFLPTVEIAVGLGGSMDVWAGQSKRAPQAVRNRQMEWAWRMISEPERIKGIPALVRFVNQVRQLYPNYPQSAQNEPEENRFH